MHNKNLNQTANTVEFFAKNAKHCASCELARLALDFKNADCPPTTKAMSNSMSEAPPSIHCLGINEKRRNIIYYHHLLGPLEMLYSTI